VPASDPLPSVPLPATLPTTTAATWAVTVADEWVRSGVTDAVVAPGSRSTPLALGLVADERLRVHVHHDERSAAFTALGLGLATGRPAVVVTTSGTAAVELHPAIVEAHHARVPLIACTADRPPELRDVGAPQTIDQSHLFGGAVRWFHDPGVPDTAAVASWRSVASRAVAEATGRRPGPVHLNLPFRDPLVGSPGEVPAGRAGGAAWHRRVDPPARLGHADAERIARRCCDRTGVIVAGGAIADPDGVLVLARTLGWPVLADPRSGARIDDPVVIAHADPVLRTRVADLRPDVVLRLGAPPASRVQAEWLAGSDAVQIAIDRHGGWFDADHGAAVVASAEPGAAALELAALVDAHATPPSWLAAFVEADRAAAAAITEVLAAHEEVTEPGVARAVLAGAAEGSDLVVSSSMPVRDLEWFGTPREGVRVLANRGANGIDGVVSTAVGVALAGRPTTALLGDVALLHDTNGLLGVADRALDLVVVVVDNRGGGIFSFLPQAELLPAPRFERLFGTPHDVDLVALAAAHGVPGEAAGTAAELEDALGRARAGEGVRLVVARTDRVANVEVHRELDAAVAAAVG
jgi:2-succinyl-5-enolpyruvyl-6-hydroxy-3-cyclohexene-1-carboxylate synthase